MEHDPISLGSHIAPPKKLMYAGHPSEHKILKIPAIRKIFDEKFHKDFPEVLEAQGGEVIVKSGNLDRHTFLLGKPGYGKTMAIANLVVEQAAAGCSVVMLDPKKETLFYVMDLLLKRGLSPECFKLTIPTEMRGGLCTFNPLECSDYREAVSVVTTFCSVISELVGEAWSGRMGDFTNNAAVVVCAVGQGSVLNLFQFMQDQSYRQKILGEFYAQERTLRRYMRSTIDFFHFEFDRMTQARQEEMAYSVLNKLRILVGDEFFELFLAPMQTGNALDFNSLFFKNSPQRIHLIHLDRGKLGDLGTRFLAGIMASYTLRTTYTVDHPDRKVVLCVDEVGVSEKFLGESLNTTVVLAREKGLRLLLACQGFYQLPSMFRSAVIGLTDVKLFFQISSQDAPEVSRFLSNRLGSTKVPIRAQLHTGSEKVEFKCRVLLPDMNPEHMYHLIDPTEKDGEVPYAIEVEEWIFKPAYCRRIGHCIAPEVRKKHFSIDYLIEDPFTKELLSYREFSDKYKYTYRCTMQIEEHRKEPLINPETGEEMQFLYSRSETLCTNASRIDCTDYVTSGGLRYCKKQAFAYYKWPEITVTFPLPYVVRVDWEETDNSSASEYESKLISLEEANAIALVGSQPPVQILTKRMEAAKPSPEEVTHILERVAPYHDNEDAIYAVQFPDDVENANFDDEKKVTTHGQLYIPASDGSL